MNRPAQAPADDTAEADLRLQRALRSVPPAIDAARLDALQSRVLAQWQVGAHGANLPMANGGWRSRSLSLIGGPRRGWMLASGLLLGVSLAAGFWLQRPDPALEELLQPDVLSQMAIGEM
jgi:hypothetical protein